VEHPAVLATCRALENRGFIVIELKVDKYGQLNLDELESHLDDNTAIVSIMYANNETGVIFPIEKIGEMTRERGIPFHTDAVQAVGKIELNMAKSNIDMLSLSGHKLHAPKGIGVLYVRKGTRIDPLLHGGGHEFGLRSSTSNLAAIVGFVRAAEISLAASEEENARLTGLRDRLITELKRRIPKTHLNGHPAKRLPNNVNLRFDGIEGESILMMLNLHGIAAATGSACSSRTLSPSHVLLAMGIPPEKVHGSLRLSLGRWTREEDIERVIETLPKIVKRLRTLSPVK
jgi:cysteine desulfurase